MNTLCGDSSKEQAGGGEGNRGGRAESENSAMGGKCSSVYFVLRNGVPFFLLGVKFMLLLQGSTA